MRKKIEKNFWDMEIIGNRRKIIIFLFLCTYLGPIKNSSGPISYRTRTELGGNNLVCEFCDEKQLSLETLERHRLSVHGAVAIQNPKGNL